MPKPRSLTSSRNRNVVTRDSRGIAHDRSADSPRGASEDAPTAQSCSYTFVRCPRSLVLDRLGHGRSRQARRTTARRIRCEVPESDRAISPRSSGRSRAAEILVRGPPGSRAGRSGTPCARLIGGIDGFPALQLGVERDGRRAIAAPALPSSSMRPSRRRRGGATPDPHRVRAPAGPGPASASEQSRRPQDRLERLDRGAGLDTRTVPSRVGHAHDGRPGSYMGRFDRVPAGSTCAVHCLRPCRVHARHYGPFANASIRTAMIGSRWKPSPSPWASSC